MEVPAEDSFALNVYAGAANLVSDGGPVRVAAGQRVQIEGRHGVAKLAALSPADAFDDWILAREVRLAEAEPSDLDRYGDWYGDATYGRVWSPNYTGGWTPIHDRSWRQDGFGWSWVIAGSWGFVTFRSGHWSYIDNLHRWCWVPRPVPHPESFASDTRPYGHARVQTASTTYYGYGGARSSASGVSGASGTTIFRSFGGGGQSAAPGTSGSGGSVATMRPSGSSSNSARGPASVFAGPSTR
jgi:hypothetical protein